MRVERCCSWLLPVLAILRKQSLGGSVTPPPRPQGFGDVPWAETLGLAGKSPLAGRALVQLEALRGNGGAGEGGGSQCPLPSSTQAAAR